MTGIMPGKPVVSVKDLTVRRGGREVVRAEEISVRPGEILAVIGPNGAGKSSLLQALAWLIPAGFAEYRFGGETFGHGRRLGAREILDLRRRMAVVFQEPLLLEGTVLGNAALGLRLRGRSPAEAEGAARVWLERLGVAGLAERPSRHLSHGEAQRVSLARALALEPEAIFLDEPFASLDSVTRLALVRDLKPVLRESGAAVILVTHDFSEVVMLADRVAAVEEGRLCPLGSLAGLNSSLASPKLREMFQAAQQSAAALINCLTRSEDLTT